MLEGLEHIRGHPVWGKALACLDDDSWCPGFILLGQLRKTLARIAANRMLDDKSLQQLQKAFPALVIKVEATSEHEQQLQCAMMSPDSVREQPLSVRGDTMRNVTGACWLKGCAVLVMPYSFEPAQNQQVGMPCISQFAKGLTAISIVVIP